jgi:hypothetical protein
MKNINFLVMFFVVISCLFMGGCAQPYGQQFALRGYPNAPHQRVTPLYVDQNVIYSMSPQQFDEYRRRVNWATDYNRKLIRNDVAAANAAKSWTGSSNSYHNDNFGRITRDASRTLSNEISRAIRDGIRNMFE